MHIPDGFLSPNTWIPAWLFSITGLGYFIRRASRVLKDRMLPLMGLMSAFIFAAQMVNFPVLGGTSGHLLGGVLAAVLLGPYAAPIVMACVLIVQCLLFQDGGLTALGANIFNMAIVGTVGGYVLLRLFQKIFTGKKGFFIALFAASWVSIILAATACSFELAVSGTVPLKIVLPAMLLIHSVIGIGEALITVMIVHLILKVRPDLLYVPMGGVQHE